MAVGLPSVRIGVRGQDGDERTEEGISGKERHPEGEVLARRGVKLK
jgi:hypothetical protein